MMRFDGFDWDKGNSSKCQKHGVSISEIEAVMLNTPVIAPDIDHSHHEDRYIAIGCAFRSRYVFIAFTLREKNKQILVRPVSARYMHKKEVESYEKARSKNDNGQRG